MSTKTKSVALKVLSSQALTILSLLCLMVLTVVGTLEQVRLGLYQSQKIYFESFVCWLKILKLGNFTLSVPFPGAYTVFIVMFVNLAAAFMVKFRWYTKRIGLLLAHVGLVILLVGSFFTYHHKQEGHLSLYPEDKSNVFVSYHENEILVIEQGDKEEKVTGFEQPLIYSKAKIQHKNFPFTIHVEDYYPNSGILALSKQQIMASRKRVQVTELPLNPKSESNRPGAKLQIDYGDHKEAVHLYLDLPIPVDYKDKRYFLILQRKTMPLPFTVKLIHFQKEYHPKVEVAKHFESKIKIMEDDFTDVISMNNPYRRDGFTFYQASFIVNKKNQKQQSVLSVVYDPAQTSPYISFFLVFFGIFIHFMQSLLVFLKRRSIARAKL